MKSVNQVFLRTTPNREGVEWDHRRTLTLPEMKDMAAKFLRHETVEVFGVFLLNHRNNLLAYAEVSRGTIHSTMAEPREIARVALLANATSVVLMHNHPNEQIPDPSDQDVMATKQIVDGLALLKIHVQDHLIVAEEEVESLMVQPSPPRCFASSSCLVGPSRRRGFNRSSRRCSATRSKSTKEEKTPRFRGAGEE